MLPASAPLREVKSRGSNWLAAHPGTPQFGRFRKSFLKRMWNAGEFMKTLKQHFTMSYNSRREHAGTMWEGRYHVRVHKPLVLHASLSLAAGEGWLH